MLFEEICGHESQIELLKNSMIRNRVAHAYFFSGMEGVGKKTTAIAFAGALNCKNKISDSCGICSSCRKISRGTHPDVLVIKPQNILIRIQDIRDMQEQLQFRPFEGRRRVVLIDDAHKLSEAAANALLKTLEEPMPYNVIILLASRYKGLPKTILSRCQKIRFNPVHPVKIRKYLINSKSFKENDAEILAAASQGIIGRIIEQNDRAQKNIRLIQSGIFDIDDPFLLFSLVNDMEDDRKSVLEELVLLREWFRDSLLLKETGRKDLLIHPDLFTAAESLSGRLEVEYILKGIEAVTLAISAIERNANKQLTLESMIFKLSYLSSKGKSDYLRALSTGDKNK
ncbi:MAG: DNA polymerase III subunit delta' [Syntrophales bacterium]|jgi:DNA polymerase-3 subunit delta'|nr:DNA polymerase III subunit delta' [Syntrophales bacterium]MDY0043374.1 DNA polymerase III subunit delta' [Syntrophales bacterium]